MGDEYFSGVFENSANSNSFFEWPRDNAAPFPFLCSITDHNGDFANISCGSQILLEEDNGERSMGYYSKEVVLKDDWSPRMFLQQQALEEEQNPPDHDTCPPIFIDRHQLNSGYDDGFHEYGSTLVEHPLDFDITQFLGVEALLDHNVIPSNSNPDRKGKSNKRGRSLKSNGDERKNKRPQIDMSSKILPTFNTRREKMQDRINALQQLVSPFGRSDTASVLLETIEYINYLHSQVKALLNSTRPQSELQNSNEGAKKDLEGRGLRMVPLWTVFESLESASPVAGLQHLEDLMRKIASIRST